MSDMNRESSEVVTSIGEHSDAWAGRNASDGQTRTVTESNVDIYDALDYRLMATFPASDAVAQY